MLITEIYRQHNINKGLAEHMVRVAAVARVVSQNSSLDIDEDSVVSACLLHDMGNLLKIKFEDPEFFEPEGVAYWQEMKMTMSKKYGESVTEATNKIIAEINPQSKVVKIVEEASFEDIEEVARTGDFETKLMEYSDMRVALHGVVSLEERFSDLADRYAPHRLSYEKILEKQSAAKLIEEELFAKMTIKPEEITDESTVEIQNELWGWDVATS